MVRLKKWMGLNQAVSGRSYSEQQGASKTRQLDEHQRVPGDRSGKWWVEEGRTGGITGMAV